jgi:hypothetical protein
MMFQGEVSNYSIQISASNWLGPLGYTRVVALTGAFGIAFLSFVPAGRIIPTSSKRAGTTGPDVFDLFLPMDDYGTVVDLVRNEKPVFWFFDDGTLQIGVRTQAEPIGEQEGV